MSKHETVDTELLLEEILASVNALKEASSSQREILDSVALNQLDRVMVHKNVLIDKIRAINLTLKERGVDLANINGSLSSNGNGGNSWNHSDSNGKTVNCAQKISSLRRNVERTIREILAMEADSQRKLLTLKQHVRGILLDIQERRKMLRGYAVNPGRTARVLDTKT
jgi:hypothetical protein